MSNGVNLKPSDAIHVSGLINNENVTIKSFRATMFDYKGKFAPVPAVEAVFERIGGDDVTEYLTVGSVTGWSPLEDGSNFKNTGSQSALSDKCNLYLFLQSLVNSGFPEDRIEDLTSIENTDVFVVRVPAPERGQGTDKKEKDTILTVTKVNRLPWEKEKERKAIGKGKERKGKGKGKGKETESESNIDTDIDVEEKCTEFILKTLADRPDGVRKMELPAMAFKEFKDSPIKNEIIKKIFDDNYLKSMSQFWAYDGGILKQL